MLTAILGLILLMVLTILGSVILLLATDLRYHLRVVRERPWIVVAGLVTAVIVAALITATAQASTKPISPALTGCRPSV